jgi:hypothetical protein
MNQPPQLSEQAALSLIAADLQFYRTLFLSPRLEAMRSIASLALLPFLSAFVYESAEYLKRTTPDVDLLLQPHRELLRASRLRLKLLDDNRRSFDDALQHAADLAAVNSGWFRTMHGGKLGPIRNLIQPDLGVYFVGDDVVCTTHVAFLNLGLSKSALAASTLSLETIGPHMHGIAIDLGGYMALLMISLGFDVAAAEIEPESPGPTLWYRDLMSGRFYDSMARTVAPSRTPICLLLTSVLSQINTVRLVVPGVAGCNTIAAFKIGFVALYHAVFSLQTLMDEDNNDPFLTPEARQRLCGVLRAPHIQRVRASRDLRNCLVHYGVAKATAPRITAELPLFGLVEAHVPGQSLSSLKRDVDIGLNHLAGTLKAMLPRSLTPAQVL